MLDFEEALIETMKAVDKILDYSKPEIEIEPALKVHATLLSKIYETDAKTIYNFFLCFLYRERPGRWFCLKCGAKLRKNASSCSRCGTEYYPSYPEVKQEATKVSTGLMDGFDSLQQMNNR